MHALHFLATSPGQVITCTISSGLYFAQGFAIFIDWNQDNIFQTPTEVVAWTTVVPSPPGTPTVLTFSIPTGQANGSYRMRVRCNFVAAGNTIDPCASYTYGEAEDYAIYINTPPIVPITGTASVNSPVCEGSTFTLNVVTTATAPTTYSWSGPGNYGSTLQNPSQIAVLGYGGIYTVTVANGPCPITCTTNLVIQPLPQFTVAPASNTVCQGGSFLSVANTNINPNFYSYQWSGPVNHSNPQGQINTVATNLLPAQTPTAIIIYSIVVTPTALNCPVTQTMSVRINNPATPTLSLPAPFCNTSPIVFGNASPGGGTWYGNPLVATNGIINPLLAASTPTWGMMPISYSITIGTCTNHATGNISVSKFQTAALTGTIPNQCVNDLPFNLSNIVLNNQGNWSGVGTSANTFTAAGIPTGIYTLTYYNTSTPFPNVCPASNTLAVKVFNPPIPYIAPILPKCTNSPSLALLASPPGGLWTGNQGISFTGIYTPGFAVNPVGTNSVNYTAGQGTCVATSSTTFHVSSFKSAALGVSSLNLCVTTNSLNLMSLVTGVPDGTWTASPSQTMTGLVGTYSFNPAGLSTNTYILTYSVQSIPDPALCPDTRVLPISVLNPATPTIAPAGPYCTANAPVQLIVSPATGSFMTTPYLTVGGLFKPALSTIGNNIVQYMIGTNTCNVISTRLINVEAFVPATIIGTVPDQCNTAVQPVNLTPLTTNTLGTWTGPGVAGNIFYPSSGGNGLVTIFYNTSSFPTTSLCPAQQSLAITVYSVAPPVISMAGPFCNSMPPVKLSATPLGGVFGNNTSALDLSGVFNPAFSNIGDNIINYSVTVGPCKAYAQSIIRVEKFVSADFLKYVGPFCRNDNPIDLDAVVQNPGGTWSGQGLTGSIFTPSKANPGNNNMIRYFTQSATPDLCPDTSEMRIKVNDIPDVSIVRDIEKGCAPVEVVFNTPSTNVGKGRWTFGDASETSEGLTVSHTYTAAGIYSVVLSYWDEISCASHATLMNAVTVFDVPRAEFTYGPYDEVTIADPQVQFINRSEKLGDNTYQWQIADMYVLTEVNPIVIFPKTGEYRINLTATTRDGCKSEASDIIVIKPDFAMYVPNSFSPNYDGINDAFLPVFSKYGIDSKVFEMEIFDRWGRSLYHTRDNTKGWDGSIANKGEPLKEEVYVYKIKYKDLEGKTYEKLGYVTLVK